MTPININQLFKYATVGLFIMNIGLLSFIYIGHTSPRHDGRNHLNAHEQLNLNDQQHDSFLKLVQSHHDKISIINKEQQSLLKKVLIDQGDDLDQITSEALLHEYSTLEIDKIINTKQHFTDIKSILSESQYADFEIFRESVLSKILKTNGGPHAPPRR